MVGRRLELPFRAALAAIGLAALLGPVSAEPAAGNAGLVGTWSGEYVCNQGLTGLTLSITRGNPQDVRALFHFYEAPTNPGVPTGCFEMEGSFDPVTGRLALQAGRWLLRPEGYVTVDFLGHVARDGRRFEGRVAGLNCTTFELARRPSPSPVPRACRPRNDTVAAR
ncbi:hypothetical protein [Enterovirga rhinocerotis]|uniref:Protease inhibitor Inh n=1 Tax=Enterovirga rhinocerotis TaxID=1339210 RepID=A0A4R7CAG4_9HYPH|nr:hypothetical protein [Enterovirga rhinocerotis]TDR93996.1 hypothetical protein EV668_1265 [Enterovirga rhinocerotis]